MEYKDKNELPDTKSMIKIVSYIKIFVELMKKFSHPYQYEKFDGKNIRKSFNFFSCSLIISGVIFYFFGYYKLIDAFNKDSLKLILLLSSLVLIIGVSFVMIVSSYFIDKNKNKFDLILGTISQVLYIYGLLIPLLAIFFILMLQQAIDGLGFFTISLFLLCCGLWFFVFWHWLIKYIADFYKIKIKNSFITNIISILLLCSVLYAGNFVSFGSLSTNVFYPDRATDIIVEILLERGKINQTQADYLRAEYYSKKKL